MTVSYTDHVASCKRFGCFWKLLFRWKGSIYKLLWPNLIVYIMMYSSLSICYRFFLDQEDRMTFEKLSVHCQTYGDLIPVSFVLGFYVSIVVKRWWDQYTMIPWPDSYAIFISAFLSGADERSRLMRRTLVRYANLSLVITFRMMCTPVKKRFPTLQHLVEAGFMLPTEKAMFDKMDQKTPHPKYWVPLVWSTSIINMARREERIKDDFGMKTLIDEVNKYRGGCGGLLNYDWISVPLVYTQVVTLAVYTYFLATLMGNQYLDPTKGYPNHTIDLVVPIFTLLQFFFYMGWLLVAETLVNPFGEDDDDFEVNWLIDRNLQISYLIVDEVHEDYPDLMKDPYWEDVFPNELPYTEAAKQFYTEPFQGSARYVNVPMDQRGFVLMSLMTELDTSDKALEGERKESSPVEIIVPFSSKELVSDEGSNLTKSGRCSSSSLMKVIRHQIYGSESIRSTAVASREVVTVRNKKKKAKYQNSSHPTSTTSTFIKEGSPYEDISDDIFRMSDFSLTESKGEFNKHKEKPDDPELFLSNESANSLSSICQEEMENTPEQETIILNSRLDITKIRSWISNAQNAGSSESMPKILKGQGDPVPAVLIRNSNEAMAIFSCSTPARERSLMQEKYNEPLDAPPPKDGSSVASPSPPNKPDKDKNNAEMIIPLDEQILLEKTNVTDEIFIIQIEEGNEEDTNKPSTSATQEPPRTRLMNNYETTDNDSTHTVREIKSQISRTSFRGIPQSYDNEKPTPSPAISIPGAVMLKDHLNIPIIQEEQLLTSVVVEPVESPVVISRSGSDVPAVNQDVEHELDVEEPKES